MCADIACINLWPPLRYDARGRLTISPSTSVGMSMVAADVLRRRAIKPPMMITTFTVTKGHASSWVRSMVRPKIVTSALNQPVAELCRSPTPRLIASRKGQTPSPRGHSLSTWSSQMP